MSGTIVSRLMLKEELEYYKANVDTVVHNMLRAERESQEPEASRKDRLAT